MAKRKFREGPPLGSLAAVVLAVQAGHWLYSPPRYPSGRRHLTSPKWAMNMSLATLSQYGRSGLLALIVD